MSVRVYNGIEIDLPSEWEDSTTIVAMPRRESSDGRPPINLVVKRRPAPTAGIDASVNEYLRFMRRHFGRLEEVEFRVPGETNSTRRMVRFCAEADGRRFRQTTLMFVSAEEEISATITQAEGDCTPTDQVDTLLQSIQPASGWLFGGR